MKKRVYWSIVETSSIDTGTAFLSEAERSVYDTFRFDLRRTSYLAGRWTAKQVLQKAKYPQKAINEIAILNEASGKPYYVVGADRIAGVLSISHAGNWGAAAFTTDDILVGLDVEVVAPRPTAFIMDYFTPHEKALLKDRSDVYDRNVTLIWSAKEAMLKALGLGLRLDTRQVRVVNIGTNQKGGLNAWNPLGLESENRNWFGY